MEGVGSVLLYLETSLEEDRLPNIIILCWWESTSVARRSVGRRSLDGLIPQHGERRNYLETVHLQGCDGGPGICRGWCSHASLLGLFFCCLKHLTFSRIWAGASCGLAQCPQTEHLVKSSVPIKRRGGWSVSGRATAGAAGMTHLLVANTEQIISVHLGCLPLMSLCVLPR